MLLSTLLIVLLMPVLIAISIAVKLDSRGPILYRCRRVGFRGRQFDMLKFRKMHHGASGSPLTHARDERFTRVGRFLARTKYDELPQLWNVVRGRMSLVGPRPEDPYFVSLHQAEYEAILEARPGITGLSQLVFARESRLLAHSDNVQYYVEQLLPQKLALDRLYVARRSAWLDLRILLSTLLVLLTRRSVVVEQHGDRVAIRTRRIPPEARQP